MLARIGTEAGAPNLRLWLAHQLVNSHFDRLKPILDGLFEPLILQPELVVALLLLVEVQPQARAVQGLAAPAGEEPIGQRNSPLELAGLPSGVVGHAAVRSSLDLRWLWIHLRLFNFLGHSCHIGLHWPFGQVRDQVVLPEARLQEDQSGGARRLPYRCRLAPPSCTGNGSWIRPYL